MTSPTANARPGVSRDALRRYLAERLDAETGADWATNGLQVEGTDTIRTVVTGVSACQALFDEAAARGADAIIVHHGLFWHGQSPLLTGVMGRRVKVLLANDINLFAYHLPLDRHPELGNNALAIEAFGLVDRQPFAEVKGLPVGFRGRFPTPIDKAELIRRCAEIYGQAPLAFEGGPDQVSTVGIASGGGAGDLQTAIDAGLDAYITGEPAEWAMNLALESGIHFLAAGHHATERLGVRAVGEHLAERFSIEAHFVDVPNPV